MHRTAQELPRVVAANFGQQIQADKVGICGHSMGGHGALTIAMKNPVRAFVPACLRVCMRAGGLLVGGIGAFLPRSPLMV